MLYIVLHICHWPSQSSPIGDRTRVGHMTGHMTFFEETVLGQPDMTVMEDPVEKSE